MTRRGNYRGRNNRRRNKDDEQMVSMPLWFAKSMMRQTTYNPQNASSKKSYSYSVYSKENILKWLQAPSSTSNEKSLRDASRYMYVSSMYYNRLLNTYAGLYQGAYVISPLAFDESSVKKESFVSGYKKAAKALELMNIPQLVRETVLITLTDAVEYGVWLKDSNSAFVQKIDPDYCRVTAICDGSFLYKVDMTKISSKLEFYPAEFTEMYQNYLATGDQWQEVPVEISYCVKADSTQVDFSVPPFAPVMPSLYTIANTEALQETATELKNYKMLAGKIPMDEKGRPLMDEKTVKKYYQHVANALGDNVGLAISPFDFDTFTFENKTGVSDVDDLSRAVANFWSNAGTSGLLHGMDNETAGVMKLAAKNDETYILGIIQQIERLINRYLKTLSGTVKFKINILPVTNFNKAEMLQYYKEASTLGLAKSHYAAVLGIQPCDVAGFHYLEETMMPFEKLTPLKSTYTSSGDSDGAGRPQSNDEDLTESGASTRDNDTNANR